MSCYILNVYFKVVRLYILNLSLQVQLFHTKTSSCIISENLLYTRKNEEMFTKFSFFFQCEQIQDGY